MPAQLNRVAVEGNLTRDPELRHLASGDPVCGFRIAITSRARVDGEWRDKANYIDVTVFGKQAESCASILGKGRAVIVDGRLNYREWSTDDGGKRSTIEIIANDVMFRGSPRDGEGNGGAPLGDHRSDVPASAAGPVPTQGGPAAAPGDDDDFPFAPSLI